ncbi:MAG: DUF2282 domain-containing protein [Steroidobacteraceae bacterium]|jgi:uncharacterized membrane protein
MNRYLLAASTLSAAVGLALALQAPVRAADTSSSMSANNAMTAKAKLEKCYGINATSKNDCAAGAHSCAGQASMARDPKSFVLLPSGDCTKIQGGTLAPM